jgi:hypothetical protein
MKGNNYMNVSCSQNYTDTTVNSSFNYKYSSRDKNSFVIESSAQLKKIMDCENIFVLKNILKLIISGSKIFAYNLILFYEVILTIIERLNAHSSTLIKLDQSEKYYFIKFIKENKVIIENINSNFDNLLSQSSLEFYFFSKNSHSIILILFMIMTSFTFYTFEIEKITHPKKEILRLLLRTRNKYLCSDSDKIKCKQCSLKHFELIINYLKKLELELGNKYKKINCFRKPFKLNHNESNLYKSFNNIKDRLLDIQNQFHKLECLIEEQKQFSLETKENLFSLSFNDYENFQNKIN